MTKRRRRNVNHRTKKYLGQIYKKCKNIGKQTGFPPKKLNQQKLLYNLQHTVFNILFEECFIY